mmetsp:Transcript_11723/g.17930  ORF Transcript_11723/g.17930 Transcript_11723/m.17930 type:complete len:107 (-) Transcript_11723:2374-2694(-)
MECVMILLGEKTDWANCKQVLGNVTQFMNSLLEYNVDNTSERVWRKARDGYISKPQFEPSAVRQVSVSAAALCTWCTACSKFQLVTKKVAPKKAKYAEVTKILKEA